MQHLAAPHPHLSLELVLEAQIYLQLHLTLLSDAVHALSKQIGQSRPCQRRCSHDDGRLLWFVAELSYLPHDDCEAREHCLQRGASDPLLQKLCLKVSVWSPYGLNNPAGPPYGAAHEQDLMTKTRTSWSDRLHCIWKLEINL